MKKYLFGTLVALICSNTIMNAQHHTQRAELDLHIPHLKRLAQTHMDPVIKKQLHEVLHYATKVSSAGKAAKKESLTKALGAVHRAISFMTEQNQAKNAYTSCDPCEELSSLQENLADSFIEVKAELYKLLEFLEADHPSQSYVAIHELPITLTESGKYFLTDDMVHSGAGAAITISADNVVLDCKNHSITLNNQDADGIVVHGSSDVAIENCHILASGAKSAVSLRNVQKASISNFYSVKTTQGIQLKNCQNVSVENSHLGFHDGSDLVLGAAVSIEDSESITVSKSHFEGSGSYMKPGATSNALLISGSSQNVRILDSTFSNWLNTITVNEVLGLHIDSCMVEGSPISDKNLVELGTIATQANDIQITNSSFIQKKAKEGFDGILFLNGQGAKLENIVLDITTTGDSYKPSAIHVGCKNNGPVSCSPAVLYSDIEAKNCQILGSFPYALHIENGAYIDFSSSQFADASVANIFMDNAKSCTIKDSNIQNGANGILISQNAASCGILGCEISNNDQNGITVVQNSQNAFVANNKIFGNGGYGFVDNEATTASYFNTVCKNSKNCLGVLPAQLPGTSPQTAGSNLCCTP